MSDPVSALGHARFEGYVTVEETGPHGMIQLRGDLAAPALREATARLAGLDFPDPLHGCFDGERALCWMAPDEVLLRLALSEVEGALGDYTAVLAGTHHLAVDVSAMRSTFRLSGPRVREVLAKLTPADVSPGALPVGMVRRTRIAQVPAALWMRDAQSAEVLCFRSVARYVFDLLCCVTRPGDEVGVFDR